MGKLAVPPKIDLAFKKIFSENENLLKSLLSAVLNIKVSDIKDLKLENVEILPQDLNNKFCRLDLKVTIKGRAIDVEIQLNNQGNFQNRALYYWARMFSQSLDSGENFNLLPETIVISFIDFNLFDCAEYHSSFHVTEDVRNEILTNKLVIHFFELPKIPKNINENRKIELWLKLIGAETDEELYELDKSKNKEIKEALEYVKKLNSDEEFKKRVEMRKLAIIEEKSAIEFYEQKGLREGENKKAVEMAEKMVLKNKPINEIIEFTGLSEEEINKIIESNIKKVIIK